MTDKKISIKTNYIYNIAYQILILIIPLITIPYLSRIFLASGIGIYSYTYSIVYYFMIFTLLGVNNYGNRSIAKVAKDKEKLSKTFWQIYIFQLIMGIIMLITYLLYVIFLAKEYKTIAIIQSIYIISAMLDISWFYFGLEEFKTTITRNVIVKVINLVLIFVCIKSFNDLNKYTLIMSSMALLSQLVLWIPLFRKVNFVKLKKVDVIKHIKPNLTLFIPVIAISLYKIMDKIMLGLMCDVSEVGYYENAEKIINVPLVIITSLGTVMLPHISNMLSNGNMKVVKEYIAKSIKFIMCITAPMCLGLVAIAKKFSMLYFGTDFQKTGILIMILSISLLFIAFANVIRTQYLIPNEKDKIYIISTFLGAVVNLLTNLILINKLGSIGACIATVLAEFIVMFYQIISIKKELEIKKYILDTVPFIIKAIIMYVTIYAFSYLKLDDIYVCIFQITAGCAIYVILNLRYLTKLLVKSKEVKQEKDF